MWKIALLVIGALALGGCEGTRAVVNEKIETVGDGAVASSVRATCALPYSALVRNRDKHPNLKEAIEALCGEL